MAAAAVIEPAPLSLADAQARDRRAQPGDPGRRCWIARQAREVLRRSGE